MSSVAEVVSRAVRDSAPTDVQVLLALKAALAERGLQAVMVYGPIKLEELSDLPGKTCTVRVSQEWRVEIQEIEQHADEALPVDTVGAGL